MNQNLAHSPFSGTTSSMCTKRPLPGNVFLGSPPSGIIVFFKYLDSLSIWSELSTLLFMDSLQSLRAFAKYIFSTEIKTKTGARREGNYSDYGRKINSDMWCSVGDHAEMKIWKDQFEHFSPNLKWLHLGQSCPECTLNSYSRIRREWG